MKTILGFSVICMVLLFFAVRAQGQQSTLVGAEYFFNADPGLGNGTPLTFGQGTSVGLDAVIDIQSLPRGFHRLSVRLKDQSGQWGLISTRLFFIEGQESTKAALVDYVEYFFDADDPGRGQATEIPLETAAEGINLDALIAVAPLSPGEHTISVRIRNTTGLWSVIETREFTIGNAIVPDLDVLPELTADCSFNFSELVAPIATLANGNKVSATTDETLFPILAKGTATIIWKYEDGNGNTLNQEQTIGITDVTPPIIAAPSDIIISIPVESKSVSRPDFGTAEATDNCEVDRVTNDAPEILELGTTLVTWTATDKAGNASTATQQITVVHPAEQSIDFPAVESKVFGEAPFEVAATASSGLDVTFTVVDGPANIEGNVVTLTGTGSVTIQADQSGNDRFLPAVSVNVVFCANPPKPEIEIQGSDLTQQLKLLVSNVPPGTTIQWMLNGQPIAGANQSSIDLSEGGVYRVGFLAGDCESTSDEVTLTSILNPENPSVPFSIYPNPSSSGFFVDGLAVNQVYQFKLIDLKGVVLFSKEIIYNKGLWIDLGDITAGSYLLETTGHRFRIVRKLQVSK